MDISTKKLHPPDTKVVCLGILFDTVNRTLSIPDGKRQDIVDMVESWSDKRVSTKTELQSLLGSLLYITKCVKPSRYLLNTMLQLLRDNHHTENIVLTSDFKKDLYWFRIFLKSYNGVTYYHIQPCNYRVYLDACLTGLGGCFNNLVYTIPIPKGFMSYNIAQLEMVNVVVALKVWGQCRANKRLQIFCDNKAVVDVLGFDRAKDSILATCARNVWLLTAHYNIALVVSHVEGRENTVADLLSRWSYTQEDQARFMSWYLLHVGLIHILICCC